MKKNIFILFILLVSMLSALAVTPVQEDSLAELTKHLEEIVIKADNQYIAKDKSVFVPTRKDKKVASNGATLLQQMDIPTIYVSPENNNISTAAGEGVSVFIDYLPATQEDINNLRTMDVLRVEVFDYPTDPCFNGARHAVNFVLVKYEYGGYTKLGIFQRFVDDFGSYDAASKLSYKKMTYDLSGRFSYGNSKHGGENSYTAYSFPDFEIDRNETAIESRSNQRIGKAALRAVYNSDKTTISNTVGINIEKYPGGYALSRTDYSPIIYPSEESLSETDNSSVSPTWSGDYHWSLNNSLKLTAKPEASYGRYEQNYAFIGSEETILNDVKEDAWKFGADVSLQKQFKEHHLAFSIGGGGQGNDIDYKGTTPAKVSTRYYYGGSWISGGVRFGGFWAQANVGLFYNHTAIDSQSKNELHPKYFLAAGYNFNDKNRVNLSSEMSFWTVSLSQQGSNIQILNLIDAIQGNPELEAYRYNSARLQYEWLPVNEFSMSVFGSFYRFTNPVSYNYQPWEQSSSPMMIRHLVNSGFLNNWSYGTSAALRLLDGSLNFRVGISGESVRRHGIQNYCDDWLTFNAQASYTFKNFYAQCNYQSKGLYISPTMITENPEFYSATIGWGNGDLNISLKANNPFRSSWTGTKKEIRANNYMQVAQTYSGNYHRTFAVNISYSFSYGKKVSRTNAPIARTGVDSAILK